MTGFPQVILNPKMLTLTIFLISLLHVLLPTTNASAYNATDLILLACGSPSNAPSQDGRNWDADVNSRYSSFNDQNSSIPSKASHQDPSVPPVPYLSALIIKSKFTYSFPVSLGPKFLRLYFYPEKYSTFDMTASFFSVTANSYTLLKNFSAQMHLTNESYLIKEFIVNVWDNEKLNVTFIPSSNSYAFINGIEIFSMPSPLYLSGREIPLVTVVDGLFFSLDNTTTSLETLYRLNVGGSPIMPVDDTGMNRPWSEDGHYLVGLKWTRSFADNSKPLQFTASTPAYTAPEEVYNSLRTLNDSAWLNLNNMTWKFSVDAGFHYLIRLHFCEVLNISSSEQRVFEVLINNQTAEIKMNVVSMSSGKRFPMYKDYIVMADNGIQGRDLLLTLYPQYGANPGAIFYPFLNGLEIFKVNQSNGNLAGPNPDLPHRLPVSRKSKVTSTILPIVGAILGGFALFSLLSFFVFQRRRKLKDLLFFKSKLSTTKTSSLLPSDHCRRVSIAKIKAATKDFSDQFLIGRGGFGNVYRGIIDGESTTVAIKRLNPSSRQGAHEFHTEITMLSKLRYIHLVSLIGYCDDHGEMILVYDYMPRGTLRDHLYETKNPRLSWKQRLEICIGAARGLHYLHTGSKHSIIHRDVKSSNILLDENYVAKVSDFGLSKHGPTSMSQTHVSTVVKGSFGYIDPEYYLLQQLTEKSDVYSFGVVLLEVLSGKPPVIQGPSEEKVGLAQWARSCYKNGTLDEIVDLCLAGQIAPLALQKFGEVAENCVREHGKERPTMNDVVRALEFTLQLQETVDQSMNYSDATITDEHSSENMAKSQSTSVDNSWENDLSSEICIVEHC